MGSPRRDADGDDRAIGPERRRGGPAPFLAQRQPAVDIVHTGDPQERHDVPLPSVARVQHAVRGFGRRAGQDRRGARDGLGSRFDAAAVVAVKGPGVQADGEVVSAVAPVVAAEVSPAPSSSQASARAARGSRRVQRCERVSISARYRRDAGVMASGLVRGRGRSRGGWGPVGPRLWVAPGRPRARQRPGSWLGCGDVESDDMHRGSCLCGAVSFEVAGALPGPDACHCAQCRKHSGHYFASTDVPRAALPTSPPAMPHVVQQTIIAIPQWRQTPLYNLPSSRNHALTL